MAEVKPLTIDQMGIGPSARYARDQAALDRKTIEDSRSPTRTDISVVTPHIATEFQEYLSPKVTSWALFSPPPQYLAHAHPLFTYQLVPSLGDCEEKGDLIEALEIRPEEEKEKKTLMRCLKTMVELDRMSEKIEAARNQYHRG